MPDAFVMNRSQRTGASGPDIPVDTIRFFRQGLYRWSAENPRPMPWKGEKDPYRIWLSEVILQQTRVEQGWPYFEKFCRRFPDVRALADAPEDEVFKLWEGLGYYSRARNLHATARYVAHTLGGVFPQTYEDILQLKGVGAYTAAAISSFAYNLPHAVLDGNVYRVLSRFFAIDEPTDEPAVKRYFQQLAQMLLDPEQPGVFNQAMMDFGATGCTPVQPACHRCALQPQCAAYRLERVMDLPVRLKKQEKKPRYFLYLVVNYQGRTFVRKRTGRDIWHGLYEFPLLEMEKPPLENQIHQYLSDWTGDLPEGARWGRKTDGLRQILTHRLVHATFIELHLPPETPAGFFRKKPFENCIESPFPDLKKKFAFPRVIVRFLEKND